MTRVTYLSGPMTGFQDFNAAAFAVAESRMRSAGHGVINPRRMDQELDNDAPYPIDHYIRRDIEVIMSLEVGKDFMTMLPGWEKSNGAKAERALAIWRGLAVLELEEAVVKM